MAAIWKPAPRKLLFATLLGLTAVTGASFAAETEPNSGTKPILDVCVSSGDNYWHYNSLAVDSPASIRDSVQMWADVFDIKRVYWRGLQDEVVVDKALIRKENFLYHGFYVWTKYLMKEVGVDHLLIKEAHRHGMEVFTWAPLLDFGGPADVGGCGDFPHQYQLKLTLDHPEWMPIDRHGFRRQNGPIDLSYPEARKALIDMYVGYLVKDDYDGITFFTYAENLCMRFEDEFGFNQPIVDEYKRRYGVDLRTQPFERDLWHELRGEYVTQFLRELKTALKPYGKKMGMCLAPKEPHYSMGWPETLTGGRIYMDWERWVREGIVDDLTVWRGAPPDVENRTIENVLRTLEGTTVTKGCRTGSPFDDRFKPYVARGLRLNVSCTDEAAYLMAGYPEQPLSALHGKNIYATMRVLAQMITDKGKTRVATAELIPLTKHENVLMRRLTIKAMATAKDPAALPALEDALQDPENSVRMSAAVALGEIPGPHTVAKLIEAARSSRFQLFEAIAHSTLPSLDDKYVPDIIAAAKDRDAQIRLLVIDALEKRGTPAVLPTLLAGLKDSDSNVRFRSARALALFCNRPEVVEALLKTLGDSDVVVQDRAAASLAQAGPTAGVEHQTWQENVSAPLHPMDVRLSELQGRVLDALISQFQRIGEDSTRPDGDWGYRPVGNAILAFGSSGTSRLQAMMERKDNHRLADLAWQVCYVRQAVDKFVPLGNTGEEADEEYKTRPN